MTAYSFAWFDDCCRGGGMTTVVVGFVMGRRMVLLFFVGIVGWHWWRFHGDARISCYVGPF